MTKKHLQRGFTLIEILIYSAIVTSMLTFALLTAYQIINSDDRLLARRDLTEDQKFLVQKIEWVLKNVSTINAPASGGSGDTLSVNKINYNYNPLIIALNASTTELTSGATTTALTSDNVEVSNLNFEHRNLGGTTLIEVSAKLENDTGSTTIDASFLLE